MEYVEGGRAVYRVLVGTFEGKKSLGRPRLERVDTIKKNLQCMRKGVDWIHLSQDRGKKRAVLNVVINSGVP
jgi:hypothetical protein